MQDVNSMQRLCLPIYLINDICFATKLKDAVNNRLHFFYCTYIIMEYPVAIVLMISRGKR